VALRVDGDVKLEAENYGYFYNCSASVRNMALTNLSLTGSVSNDTIVSIKNHFTRCFKDSCTQEAFESLLAMADIECSRTRAGEVTNMDRLAFLHVV